MFTRVVVSWGGIFTLSACFPAGGFGAWLCLVFPVGATQRCCGFVGCVRKALASARGRFESFEMRHWEFHARRTGKAFIVKGASFELPSATHIAHQPLELSW
jgi:hypothetical protein